VKVNSTTFAPFDISGQVSLAELSEGQQYITVYAKYNANDIIVLDQNTVYFTINTNSEQNIDSIPEFPSWSPLLITLVAVVAVAVIYRKKLHKQYQRGNYQ
jgi:hypothetical protein